MATRNEAMDEVILVLDDDPTESEPEEVPRKRKLDPNFQGKVEWSDDEGDTYDALKSRTKHKSAKRGRPRKVAEKKARSGYEGLVDAEVVDDDAVAEHIQERRQLFETNRRKLRLGGLRLPPSYSDIYFSDDERMEELQERPQFPKTNKPSRPYKDIELDRSAGLIPAPIAQYLRDYQVAGVKFLHTHFVYQTGAILGDDMGLGKTVQVAAFLTAAFGKTGDERDAKRNRKMRRETAGAWYPRALVVCPGSLLENWKAELNRWGWWAIDLYHGENKDDALHSAKAGHTEVMLTTYGTYKNHRAKINSVEWDVVVADECHCLKDSRSEVTKAMNEINALCRIGLTGTAIQNRYEELWTLLNWTNPGHFGTMGEWKLSICRPLAVGQSHDATLAQLSLARKTAQKLVHNLLPPFFLRRMKSLIADQLPKKSDRVVFCPLTDSQKEAYENFLDSESCTLVRTAGELCDCGSGTKRGWCCYTHLPNGNRWQTFVFPAMMTLQKLSNHLTLLVPTTTDPTSRQEIDLETLQSTVPDGWRELLANRESLLNLANPEYCGKWKILKKLLKFWHANGDKVLIFSHSVKVLKIFRYLFQNTSYSLSYLDGSLDYVERQRVVDGFNGDPSQFVFLISTKAGGVGLNITSANKVVIVDPHWNPSYDLQAQDRAYRIGQVRDVDVFRLVCAGTIEEIVYARQIYKQQQANIGYTASSERRYFKGVQQDRDRKGEIFGLHNLLTFHDDQVVLQNIVNKANIAEAKAGVALADVDVEKVVAEEGLPLVKEEPSDDGGLSQLAKLLTEDKKPAKRDGNIAKKPKSDAIEAILASAGVEYTHENSEVVGSSKVEQQLSRRAVLASEDTTLAEGDSALFEDEDDFADVWKRTTTTGRGRKSGGGSGYYQYNPPDDVMRRQFCTMANEFGFPNATAFALVVESWTQEQRRNCLGEFYGKREAKLGQEEAKRGGGDANEVELETEDDGVKIEKEDDEVKIEKEDDEVKIEENYVKVKLEIEDEVKVDEGETEEESDDESDNEVKIEEEYVEVKREREDEVMVDEGETEEESDDETADGNIDGSNVASVLATDNSSKVNEGEKDIKVEVEMVEVGKVDARNQGTIVLSDDESTDEL